MGYYLYDKHCRRSLYPFTATRHTADILIGILTIKQKWQMLTGQKFLLISELNEVEKDGTIINANIIPTIYNYHEIIKQSESKIEIVESETIKILLYPWQIFQYNSWAIKHDFQITRKDKNSINIPSNNQVINEENIFIEDGAVVNCCIINASEGPVYIGKNTHIMEGSMLRGPFAILENSVIKMGTKMYNGTTIGPWCVIGGEVKNSVIFGFSNKAHDGYLGDSVIGEWCNIGAGTNNSNLKNSAGDIQFTLNKSTINAGPKAGLMMGDYSRAAINTSFNTGTIVGVCCNIISRGFPPRIIPDFSWGEERYDFEKVLLDISRWKKLKNRSITQKEIEILKSLYFSNS
jgi:UDP-N-acetylglucosamine diphosphorylase/glucosamine-1-phosphate N-acetyltransferase